MRYEQTIDSTTNPLSEVVVGADVCSKPGSHCGLTGTHAPEPSSALKVIPTEHGRQRRSTAEVGARTSSEPGGHNVNESHSGWLGCDENVPVGQALHLRSVDDVGGELSNVPGAQSELIKHLVCAARGCIRR